MAVSVLEAKRVKVRLKRVAGMVAIDKASQSKGSSLFPLRIIPDPLNSVSAVPDEGRESYSAQPPLKQQMPLLGVRITFPNGE